MKQPVQGSIILENDMSLLFRSWEAIRGIARGT